MSFYWRGPGATDRLRVHQCQDCYFDVVRQRRPGVSQTASRGPSRGSRRALLWNHFSCLLKANGASESPLLFRTTHDATLGFPRGSFERFQ
jgi:hypothetical protein